MHINRRIALHQKIGKGIKFNYITSKNTFKHVSGIQNVIIYVGTVICTGDCCPIICFRGTWYWLYEFSSWKQQRIFRHSH